MGRFLRTHRGPLMVAAGYASVYGLSWLQQRTRGRPVTLVIGDVNPDRFRNATPADRKHALAFLRRSDVQVVNWYDNPSSDPRRPMMHAKALIVTHPKTGRPVAAMVGSANLTKNGLSRNWEMMATVAEGDLRRIESQLKGLLRDSRQKPWDVKLPLLRAIQGEQRTNDLRRRHSRAPSRNSRRGGCLPTIVRVGLWVAAVGMVFWYFQ